MVKEKQLWRAIKSQSKFPKMTNMASDWQNVDMSMNAKRSENQQEK